MWLVTNSPMNAPKALAAPLYLVFWVASLLFYGEAQATELQLDERLPIISMSTKASTQQLHPHKTIVETTQPVLPQSPHSASEEKTITEPIPQAMPPQSTMPKQQDKPYGVQTDILPIAGLVPAQNQPYIWLILPLPLLAMAMGWWAGGLGQKRPRLKIIEEEPVVISPSIRSSSRQIEPLESAPKSDVIFIPRRQDVAPVRRSDDAPPTPTALNEDVLNKAFDYHREGNYERVQSIFERVFENYAHDVNVYVSALSILLELDEEHHEFTELVCDCLHQLKHSKYQSAWQEVADYGKKMMPSLMEWEEA